MAVVTDGVPDDPHSAADAVRRLSYRGLFLKFLYVGSNAAGWRFLEELDSGLPVGVSYERGGRLVDNVNSQKCDQLHGMSDQAFYELMFAEVSDYIPAARAAGVI